MKQLTPSLMSTLEPGRPKKVFNGKDHSNLSKEETH